MNIVILEFFWPIAARAQFLNEAMNDVSLESFCRSRHMRDFQTGPQL